MAKTKRFEMRLTEEEYRILENRASEQGYSISEMVRQECIENPDDNTDRILYTQPVRSALDAISENYFIVKERIPTEYKSELEPIKKGVEDLWLFLR